MIGQALYLAAEAAGVRGTGIGCYFDDVLHRALGWPAAIGRASITSPVGGPVEDHVCAPFHPTRIWRKTFEELEQTAGDRRTQMR